MNIGLYDIDSKIANLALMKISTWHKKQDDQVNWYMPLLHNTFDKIYCSKIYDYTEYPDRWEEMEFGGTGHDIKIKLKKEIENCNPDYSIYPNCDYSIQLFSRGCIRKCKFCVVHEKEGYIKPIEIKNNNINGKYIIILDNNFFANPLWKSAINVIKKWDKPVQIMQGIDIRIINENQIKALNEIKIYKRLYTAWDNVKDNLIYKLKLLKNGVKYEIFCYVLIGYDSNFEQDYYRVMKLKEIGYKPYIMPYNKKDKYQKRFARWVNHKAIFNTVDWKDYK
jgi:radical SAM superfamily enzyme YgiQ (UPF0313 family)